MTVRREKCKINICCRRLAGESCGERIIAMIRNYYAEANRLFDLLIAE